MKGLTEIFNGLIKGRKNNSTLKYSELVKGDFLTDSLFNSGEIIITVDDDYNISWANSEALKIRPDILGMKCHDFIFDNSVACQNCIYQTAINTGVAQSSLILCSLDQNNGQKYWNEIAMPLSDDGTKYRAMIIISPVDNIKKFKDKELADAGQVQDDRDFEDFIADNYEYVFNNLHFSICITGNNLRIKYANDSFIKILNSSFDIIQNELITEVLPEINTIGTQKILTLVVSGTNEQTYILNLDQLAVPKKVRLSISPIKFSDAKINGLIWIIEQFQSNDFQLPDLTDQTLFNRNFGLMTIDSSGRVIQWNDYLTKILGWSESEMLGIINPVVSPTMLTNLIAEGNSAKIDIMVKNRDNERVDIKLSAFPIHDNTGTAISYVCMLENVTNDKFIKSEFKELEDMYNNFIKRFEGISFRFDSNFNPTYFNGSILELTGYTENDFLDKKISFRELVYFDDLILLDDVLRKIGKRIRTARELELRITTKTGAIKWVHFHFHNLFDDSGNIIEIQGFLYNITQRKETEEELKRSREQFRTLAMYVEQAREDEKKHLALEIHDELGHALTAIKLELAWVMKKKYLRQELMFEKVRKMNEIIEATIRKVRTISSQLRPSVLDHFGLEAALEWQAGEFQKRSAVRCKIQLDRKEVKINEQTSTAIFRIFQEILTNIAKHAKATRVDVIFDKTDTEIILKVRDNGKGFKTENIKYTKSLGILGMTERANAIGGSLSVNSVVGIGTTVSLVVPLINIEA